MTDASPLRVALPTGVLLADSCRLLARAGVAHLDPAQFARSLQHHDNGFTFLTVRPTDVPVYVEMGACDCGIVGKDMLWESTRDCHELADLAFGDCRLVLAARVGGPVARGVMPPTLRVATKYPHATRRFLRAASDIEIIKLHGSVELAPSTGLADAIVDITATGTTLRANQLVELEELATSTARLVANHVALKTRTTAVNLLTAALRRAVAAAASEGAA